MYIAIDRISPITNLLDEVFYQSSIRDMRAAYFPGREHFRQWLILSDYCLADDRINKVITFAALPMAGDVLELQRAIREFAPQDLKHSRTMDRRFVELLHYLPVLNISFVFDQNKYFAWNDGKEFQEHMADYCEIMIKCIEFWRDTTPNQTRLDLLAKNVRCAKNCCGTEKKSGCSAKLS